MQCENNSPQAAVAELLEIRKDLEEIADERLANAQTPVVVGYDTRTLVLNFANARTAAFKKMP